MKQYLPPAFSRPDLTCAPHSPTSPALTDPAPKLKTPKKKIAFFSHPLFWVALKGPFWGVVHGARDARSNFKPRGRIACPIHQQRERLPPEALRVRGLDVLAHFQKHICRNHSPWRSQRVSFESGFQCHVHVNYAQPGVVC